MMIKTECMSQEDLIHALMDRHTIQSRDNAVEICGYLTGHSVRVIAYCESLTHAEVLAKALRDFIQNEIVGQRRAESERSSLTETDAVISPMVSYRE